MIKNSLLLLLFFISSFAFSQNLYFPPLSSSAQWDTVSPASLGWCTDKIPALYDFLELQNTKGFIVLKNGRIVIEKYFGTFTKDSTWYWASAGKTITSFLIGKAQEEGYLSISDTSSKYLGIGWTDCTPLQEQKITVRNQLTMTTGLDDAVPDNHCTLDTCLIYKADAGSRWAYHNAPYTLLEKVIENATSKDINVFTQQKLKNQTGITGAWLMLDYDNVFFSKIRSMARYGLLIQNKCIWQKDTLLFDNDYINNMTNTSQNLNLSYGYLWWLNGKESFMLPGLQTVFHGSYAPDAPSDMFAALGKNGQILSISRSNSLVVVRMGNDPSVPGEISPQLCNLIWQKLNDVICNPTSVNKYSDKQSNIKIYPNPAFDYIYVYGMSGDSKIFNILGLEVWCGNLNYNNYINLNNLSPGLYYISNHNHQFPFIKN